MLRADDPQTLDSAAVNSEKETLIQRKNNKAVAEEKPVKEKPTMWDATPFRQAAFLYYLFFSPKFFVHRVVGLVYLLQYALAFAWYFADYEGFRASPLIWSLPLTGVLQSVTAIYTFTFLPKKTKGTRPFLCL